jgi:hypothetical protein
MAPGVTSTGGVLEAMVLPALKLGGYTCQTQVLMGIRPVDEDRELLTLLG